MAAVTTESPTARIIGRGDERPVSVLGLSGSLRASSFNSALLRRAVELAPQGVSIEVAEIRDLPLYDGDVEREQGFPDAVAALRRRLSLTDALLIATPEYNFSVPGGLKNAIDWLSRGPDSPLDDKPIAIMGAGGRSGTAGAQRHLREILTHNNSRVLAKPELLVPLAWERFSVDGQPDLDLDASIEALLHALQELAEQDQRMRNDEGLGVSPVRRTGGSELRRHS